MSVLKYHNFYFNEYATLRPSYVNFQVFAAETLRKVDLWVLIPRSPVGFHWIFGAHCVSFIMFKEIGLFLSAASLYQQPRNYFFNPKSEGSHFPLNHRRQTQVTWCENTGTLRVTKSLFGLVDITLPSHETAGFPESRASLPFLNNFAPGSYPLSLNSVKIAI